MIDTILFDLDGTLLKLTQDTFIHNYFGKLKKVFEKLDMDSDLAIKGVWAGTKAMMQNDGGALNCERFWGAFSAFMKLDAEKTRLVEGQCDAFYTGVFDTVREITTPTDIPARLVRALKAKGCTVVLATNPLFPECAVTTRLNWLNMKPEDFDFITHYGNSRYCKPNPGYFRAVMETVGKNPAQCIMAGNSTVEDMAAAALGIEVFLVTDCLENESGADIGAFRNGTLADLETYLMDL